MNYADAPAKMAAMYGCAERGDVVEYVKTLAIIMIETVAKPWRSGRAGVPSPAADGGGTPSLPDFATALIGRKPEQKSCPIAGRWIR